MENVELWLEADRRGMLAPEHKALLDEAIRRGLISTPKEAAPESWGDYLKGVGRSAAQGAFGLGDEGVATVRAALGEDYDQALASEREALGQFRDRHPVVSYGAEIATGAVLPMGAAGAALRGGASLGRVAMTGAKVGGAQGAAHGFGAGEGGVGNRLGSAAVGGAVGAATGAAIPVAMAGVGGVARGVGEAVDSFRRPEQAAIRDIVEAARVSGLTLDDIAAQMSDGANGGVPFNLVDAANRAAVIEGRPGASLPVSDIAKHAAGLGGEASANASEALSGRQASQSDRLRKVLSEAVGGKDYDTEINKLSHKLESKARYVYGKAYADERPFDLTEVLNDYYGRHADVIVTNTPLGSSVKRALRAFLVKGSDAGGGEPAAINRLSQYSAARNGLDDMITRSLDQFGKPTKLTMYLTDLRNSVNSEIRNTNPLYAAADDIYSDAARGIDVLQLGRNALTRSGKRKALTRFNKMTPEQRELFRIGVVQEMTDMVNDKLTTSTMKARQFDKDSITDLINKVFTKKKAEDLINELRRETTSTRTMMDVFSGSRTAPMSYGMGELADDAQIAGQALSGNVRGTLGAYGKKLARQAVGQKAAEIIKKLMATDPAETRALLRQLDRRSEQNLANELRRVIMRGRASAVGSATASTATAPQPRYPALERALSR